MSFTEITKYENLLLAGLQCCNGGRWKPSVQSYEMTLLRQTSRNKRELENHTYKPTKTNNFMLMERGKWRLIKAHSIKDRQVYKSFCTHELKPMTQTYIMENNSASQINKGTHYSIKRFRRGLAKATRKWGNDFYVVTFDFHDYFGSIPHDNIINNIVLSDDCSMWLLEQYVNMFPSDKGIGIGGEPSQDISVAYPSKLDRMLACNPKVIDSGRYMDDGYAICHTKEDAREVLNSILNMANKLGLVINQKRTKICWMKKDSVTWLKKRTSISNSGKIIMRLTRENVKEELHRLNVQKKLVDSGIMPREIADISIECWCAYAMGYDSRKIMMRVVKTYMQLFDVPWNVAKILFKRRNRGWIRKISSWNLQVSKTV